MTDPAPTLATGLVSALTATTPGSRASGSTGPSAAPTNGPARVVVDLDLPGAEARRLADSAGGHLLAPLIPEPPHDTGLA